MLAAKHHKGRKTKTKSTVAFRILADAKNGSTIRIYKGYVDRIGSLVKLRHVMRDFASANYGCDLVFSDTLKRFDYITAKPKGHHTLTLAQARSVMEKTGIYFVEEYGVDVPIKGGELGAKPKTRPYTTSSKGYMSSSKPKHKTKGPVSEANKHGHGNLSWAKGGPVVETIEATAGTNSEAVEDAPDDMPVDAAEDAHDAHQEATFSTGFMHTVGTVASNLEEVEEVPWSKGPGDDAAINDMEEVLDEEENDEPEIVEGEITEEAEEVGEPLEIEEPFENNPFLNEEGN
jgi:hypothetical protein